MGILRHVRRLRGEPGMAGRARRSGSAKEAEGKCPVSNAYRGTMQITVEAKVV